MKTKFLSILLFLASNIFAIEKSTILYNTASICGIGQTRYNGINYFSLPLTTNFQVGYYSSSSSSRGYVEFDLSTIPTNAIITNAQLNLKAYNRLPDKSSKSKIFIKSIDSFIYNQYTYESAWNAFNSGATTFYEGSINWYDYIYVNGATLVNYISQRKGLKVGLAIVGGNEQSDGITFQKDPLNLFLSISYILPTPPTNVKAVYENSTNRFITSWTPSTGIIGYNIYMKHGTYGTYKVGTTTANIYTFTGSFETGWSVLVASYGSNGESERILASTSLMISNFTLRDFGGDYIILTWDLNPNVKSYEVIEYYPNHCTIATISGTQQAYPILKSSLTSNNYAFGLNAQNPICSYTTNTVYYNIPSSSKAKVNYLIDDSLNKNTDISVGPNPAIDQLFVIGNKEPFDVIISNLNGRQVKKLINSTQTIDLSDLPSATYIVKIISGGKEITQKIIKK